MKLKRSLLVGSSLIAFSAALTNQAQAVPCTHVNSDTTLSSGQAVCWEGGNLSITGFINTSGTAGVVSRDGPVGNLTNSGTIHGTNYGVNNSSTIGAISNSGTLSTISGNNLGIFNSGSIGTITNDGNISGAVGIRNTTSSGTGSIGTITNNGTIHGTQVGIANDGAGIGTITNSGTISGDNTGLDNRSNLSVLTNSGSIEGSNIGILNASNVSGPFTTGSIGTITNSGTIAAVNSGISNFATIGTITNFGLISATHSDIVNSGTIGAITNSGSLSTITGSIAINNYGVINTLTNEGLISASNAFIYNTGSIGAILNAQSGTLTAGTGLFNAGGSIGTISNAGLIHATTNVINNEISGSTIGTIINTASGTISGYRPILNIGHIDNISNAGSILGGAQGIENGGSSGPPASAFIGTITNSGLISGPAGIYNTGTILNINNTIGGKISGSVSAINNSGGIIGIITNSGTITSTAITGNAIHSSGGSIGAITNSGLINAWGAFVIENTSVGTITNSGSINGPAYVFDNRNSTINVIHNTGSGTLTGEYGFLAESSGKFGTIINDGTALNTLAIYTDNSSTIGSIINRGFIGGSLSAIQSNGTILGAISNSGTISGAINVNQNLTITGGNAGTIGTLTDGTIATSNHNLVFDSAAYQLLKDDVSVGSGTVSNLGTIQVNTNPTITGAFAQASSAMFISGAASSTNYGELIVTGAANLASSSAEVLRTGAPAFYTGETFTIVQGNMSSDYSGITASATGFHATASTIAGGGNDDLVVTLGAPLRTYASIGNATGGIAPATGSALDQIQTSGNVNFFPILGSITGLSGKAQGNAVKSLAPDQLTPQLVSTNIVINQVADVIGQHQQVVMRETDGNSMAAGSQYQSGAVWGQVMGGDALRSSDANTDGYRQNYYGLTAGVDATVNDSATVGAAVSWTQTNAFGSDNISGDKTQADSYQLSAYGTQRWNDYFLNGLAGAGYNSFYQSRYIGFLGETATADYHGMQYMGKIEGGKNFAAGHFTLTPLASVQAVYTQNQSYTESGAGIADMTVDRQTSDAYASNLGARAATNMQTSWGMLMPEAKVTWVHDLTNNAVPSSGVLGGVNFTVTTPNIARDGAQLMLGVTLESTDNISLRAEYDGDFRSDYEASTGLLKGAYKF